MSLLYHDLHVPWKEHRDHDIGYRHPIRILFFRKILKEAEPVLKESLEKYPDFDLVVTGHSLGAGTAELVRNHKLY